MGYSMIMFNKIVLTTLDFNFPFFLTFWHCLFATIFTQILSRTTNWLPGVKEAKVSTRDFYWKFVPMATMFSAGVVCGNSAYEYLSLGYIQMVKAATPVPLLFINFAAGKETPSVIQLVIVCMVSLGVMIACAGELNFNLFGFSLQCLAMLADCGNKVLMDILLKDLTLDSLSMLYYSAPISAVVIFIGFLIFEFDRFSLVFLSSQSFLIALFANGVLAFSLNLSVMLLVANTSSMVIGLSGPIKDILLIISSVLIFHDIITDRQILGFSLTLVALYAYKIFKSRPQIFQKAFLALPKGITRDMDATAKDMHMDEENYFLLKKEVSTTSTLHSLGTSTPELRNAVAPPK